jgi:hypothetical protein
MSTTRVHSRSPATRPRASVTANANTLAIAGDQRATLPTEHRDAKHPPASVHQRFAGARRAATVRLRCCSRTPALDHHDEVTSFRTRGRRRTRAPRRTTRRRSLRPPRAVLAWQPPSTHLEPHPKIRPRELGVIATDIFLPPSARVRTLDRDRTGSQPVSVLPWLAASRTR